MKKIILLTFMISSFASAEFITGYPANIRTTNDGVLFNLNCSPTELNTIQRISTQLDKMSDKLQSIQCDVKKILNPLSNCEKSSSSTSSCEYGIENSVLLRANHPNYLAIIQLLAMSYTAQNSISFDLTETKRSEKKVTFVLNSVTLH